MRRKKRLNTCCEVLCYSLWQVSAYATLPRTSSKRSAAAKKRQVWESSKTKVNGESFFACGCRCVYGWIAVWSCLARCVLSLFFLLGKEIIEYICRYLTKSHLSKFFFYYDFFFFFFIKLKAELFITFKIWICQLLSNTHKWLEFLFPFSLTFFPYLV